VTFVGLQIDRHTAPTSRRAALEADVHAGLSAKQKTLPPKWFYDARGSVLFDQITRLPEYYPFRCEREVLHQRAGDIAALSGADTLVELGSGTSEKTRLLLNALDATGTLRRFVPFDVDETVLLQASTEIARLHPAVVVHAVVGDFEHHLPLLPTGGRRLFAFLGGTIGNLLPDERAAFLRSLRSTMATGDCLLLGTDLVKDPERLVRAYDDDAGVTAEFNLNVLGVLQRELDAELDLAAFSHRAVWDADNAWIEMHLISQRQQVLGVCGRAYLLEQGESIRTEISAKFTPDRVQAELQAAGLRSLRCWTDGDGDYAVSLADVP